VKLLLTESCRIWLLILLGVLIFALSMPTCASGNASFHFAYGGRNQERVVYDEYGPFGELIRATGRMAEANTFRYSTKYRDDESRLSYYGYRYYSPSTGRWLSFDPAGEAGGLNLYGFVGNDSINKTDFLGLILGDTSQNYLVVLAGRWFDPRALWENVTSGDTFRVASAYSYHVLKAPVDLVESIYHLPVFLNSIPELAELARSGELKCLLGAKWDRFLRASPEEQMEILGGLAGSVAGTWATGAEGLNLIKALRAARTARTLKAAEGTGARLALPAPSQVDYSWGALNTYREGGQMTAIEHINYRHAFDSGFSDVSRFAEGTSARDIQGFVDQATRYGNLTPQGADGFKMEYNLGQTIGTGQAGEAASGIRVFIRNGQVQTAFPIAVP
jgi:RHS repeat-associated protein